MQLRLFLRSTRHFIRVACVSAFCGAYAFAGVITFSGEDVGAGPGGPFPNSNTAAANFTTAASSIGTVGTINFESAPLGAFTSLGVALGVTASGPTGLNISNSPSFPTSPQLDGFNTTPSGAEYIEDQAGTVTFTFATPVEFFGAYLTGLQNFYAQDTITFSDGTSEVINAPELGTSGTVGAVAFVGFTDAGKSISSVTITSRTGNGTDYIGIDDVEYQTAASTTPEPASLALTSMALAGLFLFCRSKRLRRI